MKKRQKKLSLRRETVRSLNEAGLGAAAGGSGGGYTYNLQQCNTSCDCFDDPGTFSAYCTEECPC